MTLCVAAVLAGPALERIGPRGIASPAPREAPPSVTLRASERGSLHDTVAGILREKMFKGGRRPGDPDRLARIVTEQSLSHGLDPLLVLALIEVESTFRPDAISPVGAMGLMQVMPATGEELTREMGLAWKEKNLLFDPEENVRLGILYLGKMKRRFGEIPRALGAFNAGPAWASRGAGGTKAAAAGPFVRRVLETRDGFVARRRAKRQGTAGGT